MGRGIKMVENHYYRQGCSGVETVFSHISALVTIF